MSAIHQYLTDCALFICAVPLPRRGTRHLDDFAE